jgi:hypothetical protein
MKKLYAIIAGICIGFSVIGLSFTAQGQTCTYTSNTTISFEDTLTCTSLKINPGVTLTVEGMLLLPEGFTMNSGTLNIAPTGIVHIRKRFLLSTGTTDAKVEVINNGLLELWGDESEDCRFEMRPKSFGNDFIPYSAANSLYFTNNGTFNIKDAEFIIGKGPSESGGFFYNEHDALIYINNDTYPNRKVWLGGKNDNSDDVAFGLEKINGNDTKKHASEQQESSAPYATGKFHLFLNEGSNFVIKNTDANMVFTQDANLKQSIWGELYVHDGDLAIGFDGGSGGQGPTIEKSGGLYVFDTTPSDEDQKGMLKINAGGGDMQWSVEGEMYSTGFEAINRSNSGSNEIDVKSGGKAFIGNVGANAPSENYKIHVEPQGELFYCGNYSGGGDMIGRVDTGGKLFYAQNYYDYDYHNTDENNPNKFNVLYNGPLMNEWQLINNNTQLTNGTDTYDLYTDEVTPYFTIDKTERNSIQVSLYTPQGAGHTPIGEHCIVESDWYLSSTILSNGITDYSNTITGENPYYVNNNGTAEIYSYVPDGFSETSVEIVESVWKIENGKLTNGTDEYNAYVNNQTPYYEIPMSGEADIYMINTNVTVPVFEVNTPTTGWIYDRNLMIWNGNGQPHPILQGGSYTEIALCPTINTSNNTNKFCYEKTGSNYTFNQEIEGVLVPVLDHSKAVTTYTPVLEQSVTLASDWQIIEGVLTNSKSGTTYNTYTDNQTSYYEADGSNVTIYTYEPAHFSKTAEYDIRSDWQIANGVLTNTKGAEAYNAYSSGTTDDYYKTTSTGSCSQLATIYEYSDISFSKEDITVVTSGWYLDGTTLKNTTPQNIPYFDNTVGCQKDGLLEQIRDYNGGTGTPTKKVMWYEINPDETITIYSEIDDFHAKEGSIISNMAEWNVSTAGECEDLFLKGSTPPAHEGFLPVTLVRFKATPTASGGAYIEWVTQTETNNDYFTLYRSYNGVTFEPIATKGGAGTTTVPQFYTYNDTDFITNIAYYKLEQNDYDGKKTMSNVVAVHNLYLSTFEIERLQNNGNGNYAITFLFPNNEAENHIRIYTIMGVEKAEYTFAEGTISAVAETNLSPSGTYIVEHTNGVRKTIRKIVVK